VRKLLNALFAQAGAAAWGGVDFAAAAEDMAPAARARAEALCPGAATVLVAAFPYFAGDAPGNLSLYARGEDYHLVLGRRLKTVCDILSEKYPSYSFLPGADNSPLPEREIAWRAGLGLRGKNGLLILPPYGSYVFLGTILTDKAFDLPEAEAAPGCLDCGRCVAACPAGALTEGGVDPGRCLSHLTQYKGALTGEEEALLRAHPLVWGCDRCQSVCPYNQDARLSPLPEFREGLTLSLAPEDLEGLSNRAFRDKYAHRAFAWRGPAVLRRNLKLKE